jgi:hypothetical protein
MFGAIRDENIPRLREICGEGVDINLKDEVISLVPNCQIALIKFHSTDLLLFTLLA